ncbi:hypothetical protein ABZP36_001731 [Zizania latifolia]
MLPLEFKHDVSERTNGIVSGRKRKSEDKEPTQSIMLPLDIKHDISERINGIVNLLRIRGKSLKGALQLEISGHNMVSKQCRSMARSSRLTTSIPVERKLYGRDVEKDSIVELLMKGKTDGLGVLPLVGVGGVGKTTLARFVYHDQRIKDHFDLRMWVCVSDNFNEQRLTREMLDHVCKDKQGHESITSFDALHQKISEKIRGKRFLLVLDDMWEDQDRSRWDGLLAPLKHNEATGCMILATTRRPSVARMIGTVSKVEVKGLDEIEFWLLFKSWAFFGSENQMANPALQSIGKQIAKALRGSPLAARSVGALLNRSVSFEHWRKVQDKWKSLLDKDDDILAILKFSYEFLPVHLQHCFSYCSVFPKDHKFTEKKLVCAWISQNFVKGECHIEILEETGKQYLDNLVDWGFFEEFESHYVMHDLMHDLAEQVSSNECATLDILHYKKISPSIRHLSIITSDYDELWSFPSEKFGSKLKNMGSLQKLRTLMFFGQNSTMLLRSLHTLCRESKRLRLLRIYVTAADISSTFSLLNPYHLRYLEFIVVGTGNILDRLLFRDTYIPQALTQFYHLQVLDTVSRARGNLVVPTGMNNLINLRHIIDHENVLSTIASVGNLTSLQELTFKVQDDDNFNIRQLGSMNELITLEIFQLENVKTKEEATSARLVDKEHLKVLSLSWNDNINSPEPTEEKTRDDMLEGLEPHQNLRHLQFSRAWKILPLEEMRALKKLELIDVPAIEELSLPSLEELVLIQMPSLQSCNGITAAPPQQSSTSQEDLEFSGVNGGFGGCTSLVTLQIFGCPKLISSLVTETNDNLLLPTSIEDLRISPLPEHPQSYLWLSSCQYLKSVQLHSCKAMEDLQILDCPQPSVLEGPQHLSSLRSLNISMKWACNPELSLLFPSLTRLLLGHSPDLKSLQLGYCMSLEELGITSCTSLASIDGFHSIKNLRCLSVLCSPSISPCLQLVSQQQWAASIWCRLETLEIDDFSVLTMPLCKQLTSLRRLTFEGTLSGGEEWKGREWQLLLSTATGNATLRAEEACTSVALQACTNLFIAKNATPLIKEDIGLQLTTSTIVARSSRDELLLEDTTVAGKIQNMVEDADALYVEQVATMAPLRPSATAALAWPTGPIGDKGEANEVSSWISSNPLARPSISVGVNARHSTHGSNETPGKQAAQVVASLGLSSTVCPLVAQAYPSSSSSTTERKPSTPLQDLVESLAAPVIPSILGTRPTST